MIQVHVMQLFALPDILQSSIGKISLFFGGPPVAPIFLAVMGYFLIQSKKNTKELILRGVKLFLIGIALNIGLNLHFFFKIITGVYEENFLSLIFGIDIFICAGLCIILIALLKKYLLRYIWLTLVIIVIVLLIASIGFDYKIIDSFFKYPVAAFIGNYKWSYFPIFPWFAYVLLGIVFYQFQQKISLTSKILLLISFACIIVIVVTMKYASSVTHLLPSYYHHNYIFFLWTFVFLFFWIILCNFFYKSLPSENYNNPIVMLGRNVTIAYIFQWLLIGNMATGVYKSFSIIQCIIAIVLIMLLTIGIVILFEKFFRKNKVM